MNNKSLGITVEDDATPYGVVRKARRIVQEARTARLERDAQLTYIATELCKTLDRTAYDIYRGGNHVAVLLHRTGAAWPAPLGQRQILIA